MNEADGLIKACIDNALRFAKGSKSRLKNDVSERRKECLASMRKT